MDFFYREMISDNKRNQTILIVHGWLGMGEHWLKIGEFLADCGFHVLIPDLPNHGRSFHTEDFSYEETAIFLHDFVERKKISEKPILIGNSMGGKLIMKMADLFPNEYDKLVVVDILPINYPFLLSKNGVANVLFNLNISRFETRGSLLNFLKTQIRDKGWLALIMQNMQTTIISKKENKIVLSWKSNVPMLVSKMDKVADKIDIGIIETPTLLIRGDNSEFTKREDLWIFKEKLPNSKIATIDSCGHWVMVEKTIMFLKQLLSYIGVN